MEEGEGKKNLKSLSLLSWEKAYYISKTAYSYK